MSRCFPFPPPGYDKKIQYDDLGLLKKERHKEKKHKKEKRDKEKKEGKEKKEKHREKKDKKAKHGDNKEDKEKHRDRDNDGNTPSHEKKGVGQTDAYKERLEKSSGKSKDRENDKGTTPDGKKVAVQPRVSNGVILNQNSNQASECNTSKHVHEEDKKKANDKRTSIQLLPGKSGNSNHQRTESMVRMGSSSTATTMVGTERSKERKVDGKMERPVGPLDSRSSGTLSLPNTVRMAQQKPEAVAHRKEKGTDLKIEVRDRVKEKEVDDQKWGKTKERDRNIAIPKYRNKGEEEKAEKVKEMVDVKPMGLSRVRDTDKIYAEQLRLNDGNKRLLATQSPKLEKVDNNGNKMVLTHETSKKWKETAPNGVLYEEDVRPKKMARPTSSQSVANNGRNSGPCQNPIISVSNHPPKVTSNDHQTNGTIESPSCPKLSQAAAVADQNSASLKNKLKPSQAAVVADQNSLSPKNKLKDSQAAALADKHSVFVKNKLPHPDSKYLSQVLSVPQMDMLSDTEDMGWLFNSRKKPRVEASKDMMTQVWADAVRIESADIYALPYVIPR